MEEKASNIAAVDANQPEDDKKAAEHAKKMEEVNVGEMKLVGESAESKETSTSEADSRANAMERWNALVSALESAKQAQEKSEITRIEQELISAAYVTEGSSTAVQSLENVLGKDEKNIENLEYKVKELEDKITFLEVKSAEAEKKLKRFESLMAKNVAYTENLEAQLKMFMDKEMLKESRLNGLEEHIRVIKETLNGNNARKQSSLWSLLAAGSTGAAAVSAAYYVGKRA